MSMLDAACRVPPSKLIVANEPLDPLAIGRARQDIKPGFATRLMAKLKAAKARKTNEAG